MKADDPARRIGPGAAAELRRLLELEADAADDEVVEKVLSLRALAEGALGMGFLSPSEMRLRLASPR